ncbi:MAG: hypothetical protein LC130_04810 [Bryobacterales bacterium]|nr:hypothetical protein [Bryobacterales bacterium]MCZ2074305.1 hypothetical protein [Bryobacterales bacterium]
MINRNDDPVGWAMFVQELQDAHEHLANLLKDMKADTDYGEPELRVDLGHVYAHLNRAWRRRLVSSDFTDTEWEAAGEFPQDIEPIA